MGAKECCESARPALQRDRVELREYATAAFFDGRRQVGVRKMWKNTDRAPKRSGASFGTQSAERGLSHLAASSGDFTRRALTSKGIRLAAYRLLRRLHDRR